MARSLPTTAGWHTNPRSPAGTKFTCSRFPVAGRRRAFPRRAAESRAGRIAAGNSSFGFSAWTVKRSPWTCNREAAFRAGLPQSLFTAPAGTTWDVAAHGKRFLVETSSLNSGGRRMEAVVNWFGHPTRRVPVKIRSALARLPARRYGSRIVSGIGSEAKIRRYPVRGARLPGQTGP